MRTINQPPHHHHPHIFLLVLLGLLIPSQAFQLLSTSKIRLPTIQLNAWEGSKSIIKLSSAGNIKKETELLDIIKRSSSRRDEQNPDTPASKAKVRQLINELEASRGIAKPALAKEIDGKWKLLFTSGDDVASPIQRTFVGNAAFTVYQSISIYDYSEPATVSNIVDFGRLGELKVTALASTSSRPIPNFTPRRGDGKVLGLNLLGISKTEIPADPDTRIDFKFDGADFDFRFLPFKTPCPVPFRLSIPSVASDEADFDFRFLPFKIPYPVPFRLLNDEVKGWLEVTYLSPRLRISRGNKGTIFILEKEE